MGLRTLVICLIGLLAAPIWQGEIIMKAATIVVVIWACVSAYNGFKAVESVNHINQSRQAMIDKALSE